MSVETEPTAGELISNEASASARKKTAAAKPKGAPASKNRKAAGRPPRSSRAKPVRGGGWWLSGIASTTGGDRKPSRRNRRTERLSRCSRRAISSNRIDLLRNQLERPSARTSDRLEQR